MEQEGDVIVVDGGSGCNRSLAEEIMLRFACKKGIAGSVVDGCLRDLDGKTSLFSAAIASSITEAQTHAISGFVRIRPISEKRDGKKPDFFPSRFI